MNRQQGEDLVDRHACVTCLAWDECDCFQEQMEQDVVMFFVTAGANMFVTRNLNSSSGHVPKEVTNRQASATAAFQAAAP